MARPRVADVVVVLEICRVAANILDKQSWTADRGGLPVWGLGEGLTTPPHNQLVTKYYTRPKTWRGVVNTVMKL